MNGNHFQQGSKKRLSPTKIKNGSARLNFCTSIFFNFSVCRSVAINASEPEIVNRGANPFVASPKIGPASIRQCKAVRLIVSDTLAI